MVFFCVFCSFCLRVEYFSETWSVGVLWDLGRSWDYHPGTSGVTCSAWGFSDYTANTNLDCKPCENWRMAVNTHGRLFNHPLSTEIKRDMILATTFYRTGAIAHSSVHRRCSSLGFQLYMRGSLFRLPISGGSPALCSPQSRSWNAPGFGKNFQGESRLWYSLTN